MKHRSVQSFCLHRFFGSLRRRHKNSFWGSFTLVRYIVILGTLPIPLDVNLDLRKMRQELRDISRTEGAFWNYAEPQSTNLV
jgi:hypothetical protein